MSSKQIIGIDISHHQTTLDIEGCKKAGVAFVILKATQGPGDFLDPKFKERWMKLKQAGITRGAYHFFEASQDGVSQANFLIKAIKDAGGLEIGDLPPTLDWESDRYRKTYPVVSFTKQEVEAVRFARRIHEVFNVWPIFYTGRHRLAENKHSQFWADNCPLWEADYVGDLNVIAPYKKVSIWQKSDNAKRDANLSMGGDFNIFQGTGADLEALKIKPLPTGVNPVEVKEPMKMTRDQLVDAMMGNVKRLINLPVREDKGKNRSVIIDSWNSRVGAPKGTPYCAASIWCEWKDTCDQLGLKFPMNPTAASQAFVEAVPMKYIRKEGSLGHRGDAGVLQVAGDPGHGHMTILREDQTKQPEFKTYEFNTNQAGSRDGDGGYAKTRNTIDKSALNAGKLFRAFVDIPQWILDVN